MKIETVETADLCLDPSNARKHGERSIREIKNSLSRFGQQKPVVIDSKNVVRAGNGTVQAALELGWTHVDAVRSDLSAAELKAFAVADNRSTEHSTWDWDVLAEALTDPDLGDVGFADGEFDRLAAGLSAAIDPAGSAPDPAEKPKSGKSIKLTREQRDGLDEAFARFREKHGADGMAMSEGQIVTLIAADWMAGN